MDEDVLVPLIVFSFLLILIGMILNHSRWKQLQKQKHKSAGEEGSGSLRTSELKLLIQEAVREANLPLHERIETLEAMLRQDATPRLPAAEEEEWLGEDAAERAPEMAPARRSPAGS